jgi:iron complex outermembrane receptor protein
MAQPSLRALFKPAERQSLWGAISRAVGTPPDYQALPGFKIFNGAPFRGPDGGFYLPQEVGTPNVKSTVLWAYELGYRAHPVQRLSVDLATFYNDYRQLASYGQVTALTPGVPFGIAQVPIFNRLAGSSYGGEGSLTFEVTHGWRWTANYAYQLTHLTGPAMEQPDYATWNPHHQAMLRSSWDLTHQLDLDVQLRYVDHFALVGSYVTADARLAYRPAPGLEISVVGQNLLAREHAEQGPVLVTGEALIPRAVYAKVSWQLRDRTRE